MGFFELFMQSLPRLVQGIWITLQATLISLLVGTVLGIIFGLFSVSKVGFLRGLNRVYVDIIRGTPLIVQAFFIYFGIPNLTGIRFESFIAGTITLTLNAGAYIAEIVRGGIQAVNVGQMEAARSLGMPRRMAMRKVILPQAVRTMIPALINQFIITLKDSSILSVIGMPELTQKGKLIIANNFRSAEIWMIVGAMYFIVIMVLTQVSKVIERNLEYGKS